MKADELYKAHLKTKIVRESKKVYMSVFDYFKEGLNNAGLYSVASQKADMWIRREEEKRKKAYLDDLKKTTGFFSGIFRSAPDPYSKDFKDGFIFGYIEACKKETFLADNVSQEKLDKFREFCIDNGISICAVNNELLIQNSKEIGEVVVYKLADG